MSERWKRLSVGDEKKLFEDICEKASNGSLAYFKPDNPSRDEQDFREMLLNAEQQAKRKYPEDEYKDYKYQRDIDIGLALYKFFENDFREFSTWEANDRHMWSYLSLKIVPDIIFRRGGKTMPIPNLYYKRPSRMYLRKLWWFIHLSLVKDRRTDKCDVVETRLLLGHLREQDANELMDRSSGGFHVEFSRIMMNLYSKYCKNNKVEGTPREDFFRALIREHHLRMQITSPELEGEVPYFNAILEHAKAVLQRNDDNVSDEEEQEPETDEGTDDSEEPVSPNDIDGAAENYDDTQPTEVFFELRSGEKVNIRDIIPAEEEKLLKVEILENDALNGMRPQKVNEYLEQWFCLLDNPYDLRQFLHFLKAKWAKEE